MALQANGADLVELGIPYSDPLADGLVIQAAASRALEVGTTPACGAGDVGWAQGRAHHAGGAVHLQQPTAECGYGKVLRRCRCCGAAGLVVPDLPLEEAEKLSPIAAAHGLDLVLLVAPTTPAERMGRIAAASRGFTYMVSVTGVTGERAQMESRVAGLVGQLKAMGPRRWPWALAFPARSKPLRCAAGAPMARLWQCLG